jgi:hypothetical protein
VFPIDLLKLPADEAAAWLEAAKGDLAGSGARAAPHCTKVSVPGPSCVHRTPCERGPQEVDTNPMVILLAEDDVAVQKFAVQLLQDDDNAGKKCGRADDKDNEG